MYWFLPRFLRILRRRYWDSDDTKPPTTVRNVHEDISGTLPSFQESPEPVSGEANIRQFAMAQRLGSIRRNSPLSHSLYVAFPTLFRPPRGDAEEFGTLENRMNSAETLQESRSQGADIGDAQIMESDGDRVLTNGTARSDAITLNHRSYVRRPDDAPITNGFHHEHGYSEIAVTNGNGSSSSSSDRDWSPNISGRFPTTNGDSRPLQHPYAGTESYDFAVQRRIVFQHEDNRDDEVYCTPAYESFLGTRREMHSNY